MKNFMVFITPTDIIFGLMFSVFAAFPSTMILKRLGFRSWWALVCFVPAAGIIFLWYLAYTRWPAVEAANTPQY